MKYTDKLKWVEILKSFTKEGRKQDQIVRCLKSGESDLNKAKINLENGGMKWDEDTALKWCCFFGCFQVFTQRHWPPPKDQGPDRYTWNHMVQKTRRALSLALLLFCKLRLVEKCDYISHYGKAWLVDVLVAIKSLVFMFHVLSHKIICIA